MDTSKVIALTVHDLELLPDSPADPSGLCFAISLQKTELARSSLGGTVTLRLVPDSVVQVTVCGPQGSFLGSVSLSVSDIVTGQTHKHWLTLFENKNDDVYDGDYAENDVELPRILLGYRIGDPSPEARSNYASGTAPPDSLEATHLDVGKQPEQVLRSGQPTELVVLNPLSEDSKSAFFDSLTPTQIQSMKHGEVVGKSEALEKMRADIKDYDARISALLAEKYQFLAKVSALETAAQMATAKAAQAEEETRRTKQQCENDKNLIAQQAMLRFTQYEARIQSLVALLDNFKRIQRPEISLDIIPAGMQQEIERVQEQCRREAEQKCAELQRDFDEKAQVWGNERQELILSHARQCQKAGSESNEKSLKIATLEKQCFEYKALQDRLRERVKMLESCCNALRRDRDQKLASAGHHNQKHRHHDMLAVAIDLNQGSGTTSNNLSKAEEDSGSSGDSFGGRNPSLHKSATTARLIPSTSRHRYIQKEGKSSGDLVSPVSTYEQLQNLLRQRVGEICLTSRDSKSRKSGSGVLRSLNTNEESFQPESGDRVDQMFAYHVRLRRCPVNIKKVSEGHYMFGTRKITAKLMNEKLVVRVGGGYMLVEDFLSEYTLQEVEKGKIPTKKITLDGDWENQRSFPYEPSPRGGKVSSRSRSPVGLINGTTRQKVLSEQEMANIAEIRKGDGKIVQQNEGKIIAKKGNALIQSEIKLSFKDST